PRTQAVKGRLSDFQVFPKRPGCDREELVVTRINPDHSAQLLCMSTEGVRGKRILSLRQGFVCHLTRGFGRSQMQRPRQCGLVRRRL
uniref:Uncharacterized protein n=1 Tax=Oreochromis niloticus TaxID=8128 RepID=A0A669EUS4_ORENI